MNLAIYIVAGATIVAILIYALSQGRPPILERATNDQGEQKRGAAMSVNKLIETRVTVTIAKRRPWPFKEYSTEASTGTMAKSSGSGAFRAPPR